VVRVSARICASPLSVRIVIVGSTLTRASTTPRRAAATAVAAVPMPMYDS